MESDNDFLLVGTDDIGPVEMQKCSCRLTSPSQASVPVTGLLLYANG